MTRGEDEGVAEDAAGEFNFRALLAA